MAQEVDSDQVMDQQLNPQPDPSQEVMCESSGESQPVVNPSTDDDCMGSVESDANEDPINDSQRSHGSDANEDNPNDSLRSTGSTGSDGNEDMNDTLRSTASDGNEDNMNDSLRSTASDGNDDNMNDTISGNKDNKSLDTNGKKKVSKKKRKLTSIEKKRALEERNRRIVEKQLEKEKKDKELKEKKEFLEKQRQERQRLKDLEKEKKEKEKNEKELERLRLKEEKQKEKEDKQREREEIQKEKDLEKQKKLEEISEKKRKLEEEKTRRLSEKQKASEEELRKQEKQRQLLSNFFSKQASTQSSNRKSIVTDVETNVSPLFLPFELGVNQTIAPVVSQFAKKRFNRQQLDRLVEIQESNELYLHLIKRNDYKVFRCNKREKSEPEIIIESTSDGDEDNQSKKYRIKHLQFHTNVRPPYRGTFRKRSSQINGIKPFNKDTDLFDYDVESDEEWEEGGPGESLNGSDSDGSVKDDYEIDNEFFVPHGYLSEDENENDQNEDNLNASINRDIQMAEDNDHKNDANDTKCLPLLKEQVLMAERNRCFSRTMNAVVIGCIWESNLDKNQKSVDFLQSFRRVSLQTK